MSVAIVGTGISGLTLALRLQRLGIGTTVFADRTLAQHRAGRIATLACRWGDTLDRERALGVAHWDGVAGLAHETVTVRVAGTPWGHVRRLRRPTQSVDFRVYLPALLADYTARGGRVVPAPTCADAAGLDRLTAGHALVVVATGRRSLPALFPLRADRSPFTRPARLLVGGVFAGVTRPDPPGLGVTVHPEGGEIFEQVFLTDRGLATALLVEAVPGGPLEPLARLDPATPAFAAAFLATARQSRMPIAGRIDEGAFGLLGPDDGLVGAITPVVRHGVAALPGGRTALAIGDAWITWDPVAGKGANVGAHCAWVLAGRIAAGGPFDARWAAAAEAAMWAVAGPVWEWTGDFLATAGSAA